MEEKELTPTCLLCNSYFDRKPAINFESDDDGGNQLGDRVGNDARKFKTAFNIFLRLLKGSKRSDECEALVLGREFGQDVDADGKEDRETFGEGDTGNFRDGQPCCGSCYVALVELCKLEEIIKETQAQQRNVLDNLKLAVSSNRHHKCCLDKGWLGERAKLLECVADPEMNERSQIGDTDQDDALTTESHYYSNGNDFDPPVPDCVNFSSTEVKSKPEFPSSQGSDFRKRSSDRIKIRLDQGPATKKRKRRHGKDVCSSAPSSSAISAAKMKPCSVPLERLNIEDFPDLRINGPFRPQLRFSSCPTNCKGNDVQLKMQQSTSKVFERNMSYPTPKSRKSIGNKSSNLQRVFYYINEEILLFLCTPIKYSPTGFKCLEPNCTHFEEGSDYFTFENIKHHVTHYHEKDYIAGIPSSCPICKNSFKCGRTIRRHLLASHTTVEVDYSRKYIVVCESCWRPMPHYLYALHTWLHKNEEERAAVVVASGDKLDPRLKKNLGFYNVNKEKWKSSIQMYQSAKRDSCEDSFVNQLQNRSPQNSSKENTPASGEEASWEGDIKSVETEKRVRFQEFKRVFYPITEEILLFLCTPIRFSPAGFTCLEPSCTHFVEGSEYFTFENIKEHVINCHEKEYEFSTFSRTCPVCEDAFSNAVSFRRHILVQHTSARTSKTVKTTVVCQSCWKHIAYYNLPLHMWSHKSDGEKAEMIASGEILDAAIKKKVNRESKLLVRSNSARIRYGEEQKLPTRDCVEDRQCVKGLANSRSRSWRTNSKKFVNEQISDASDPELNMNADSDSDSDYQPTHEHGNNFNAQKLSKKRNSEIPCQSEMSDTDRSSKKRKGCTSKSENTGVSSEIRKRKMQMIVNSKSVNRGKQYLEQKLQMIKFKHDDLFFFVGENFIFYRDVILQFSTSELNCMEMGCGARIPGTEFNSFELFRKHVSTKKRELDFMLEGRQTCPICRIEFIGILPFRDHIFNDHSPPALCTSCWKPVQNHDDMKSHSQLHMNQEEREASYLTKTSGRHQGIKYCKDQKTNEAFTCGTCSKQFTKLCNLKYHEVRHLPKQLRTLFDCPDCGLQLLSKAALRSHIERTHRPDLITKKRKCYICSKEFHYRDGESYRTHIRSHTGETPFVCEICGMGFKNKEGLKNHSLTVHINANVRPYQCEFCAMKYKSMKSLKRHQRSAHSELIVEVDEEYKLKCTNTKYLPGFIGPKLMYPCEYCSKVFELRSRMTKHVTVTHANVNEIVAPTNDPLATTNEIKCKYDSD